MKARHFLSSLYVQVLIGIVAGVLFGLVAPSQAVQMKVLGDGFIKTVKMLIAPIVFTTIVGGIAQTGAVKDVGRIGLRALVYFEVLTVIALALGLVVVNVVQPGRDLHFDPASVADNAINQYASVKRPLTTSEFVLEIIPNTVVGAFADGNVVQVLTFSTLFGLALLRLGPRVRPLVDILEQVSQGLFEVVAIVMRLAPLGSFGAMAFTIGNYGVGSLVSLGKLLAGTYVACLLFVFVVLGIVTAACGLSIITLVKYLRDEIFIVLGTSSSESALPQLMRKLERLGCSKAVVGLVVPAGYSFNLDGTAIYMSMAAVFVAQVSGVHMSLSQQLTLLAVLLVTSKGAAAVTGSGFVTLAATLAVFPSIPSTGLVLLIGIDRFMSEARAITNLIGNAVATVVVARWDGALDVTCARRTLAGTTPALAGVEAATVSDAIQVIAD